MSAVFGGVCDGVFAGVCNVQLLCRKSSRVTGPHRGLWIAKTTLLSLYVHAPEDSCQIVSNTVTSRIVISSLCPPCCSLLLPVLFVVTPCHLHFYFICFIRFWLTLMTWWDIYLYINNYLHFYVALFCLNMGTDNFKTKWSINFGCYSKHVSFKPKSSLFSD